jgi:hypothetical protein
VKGGPLAAFLALALLAATGPAGAHAQADSASLRRLQEFEGRHVTELSQRDFSEISDLSVQITRELLESKMLPQERARLKDIRIEIKDLDNSPPAWVDGSSIVLTENTLGNLFLAGLYLGHDIYILGGGRFKQAATLLAHPFAARRILPLVGPLHDATLNPPPLEFVICRRGDGGCREAQAAAMLIGTVGFVLAHEMGHVLLGHNPVGPSLQHPIEEEIAADSKGWELIHRLAPQLSSTSPPKEDLGYYIGLAIEAGPFLSLRMQDSGASRLLAARREALVNKIRRELKGDLISILKEDASRGGGMKSVRVESDLVPEALYINGVQVRPAEVLGRDLRVYRDVTILAVAGSRAAYVESSDEPIVRLSYENMKPGVLSAQALEHLADQGEWFAVFLSTAAPALGPRSAEVAPRFYEALFFMGLGQLIEPADSILSVSDRRRVERWRSSSLALANWR